MNVTSVESTTLKSVGYDETRGLLRLEFRSLAVYEYFGVPVEIHGVLLRASSVGTCFNERVRGRFPSWETRSSITSASTTVLKASTSV